MSAALRMTDVRHHVLAGCSPLVCSFVSAGASVLASQRSCQSDIIILVFAPEHALRPSEERAHGAGLLLAESIVGVGNGLHSKAAVLLPLLLREDVLNRSDLKPATEVGRRTISQACCMMLSAMARMSGRHCCGKAKSKAWQ